VAKLKAKTTTKLNSTKMDFWRRSARISRKDKIRNNVINKTKRSTGMATIREKETRQTQTYLGGGD
jgi:hypothetical protein